VKIKKDVYDVTKERHCGWQKHYQQSVRDMSNKRCHCGGWTFIRNMYV